MSVINRMLRDLDQRQKTEHKAAGAPAAAAPTPFPWAWLLGAFVIAAIAVVAVVLILQQRQPVAEPGAVEQQSESVMTTTLPESEPAPVADPEPVATTSLEMVELQTPIEPELEATPVAEPEPEPTPTPTPESKTPTESEVAVAEPAPPAATEEPKGTMQVEQVRLSPAELAEVKLKQAREAMQAGERERAGSLFEQVIALAPEHIDARSELAAYWYGRGRVSDALAVLEQGLQLRPQQSRWLLLYARILFNGGAYGSLLSALEQMPLQAAESGELMQLRAAAANEQQQFSAAAQDYQWLAERDESARWWLAAAVAYEDAEQPEQALSAYQQALASDDLNADGRRYAAQRLQVLGGQ
ncbi:tetratricopeptide repeat protein [Pseudidiomarina sp. YC-516-91]|uniref:tetratricopeptide repeat protein n=1 Tax=Pseudidiomarina salilacus TaxID=3384452 RepID=UPI00398484D7